MNRGAQPRVGAAGGRGQPQQKQQPDPQQDPDEQGQDGQDQYGQNDPDQQGAGEEDQQDGQYGEEGDEQQEGQEGEDGQDRDDQQDPNDDMQNGEQEPQEGEEDEEDQGVKGVKGKKQLAKKKGAQAVKPEHAHSRFSQDPHHHVMMAHFHKIASQGLTPAHIESFVHIGTFAMAHLAKQSGMTAGHEEGVSAPATASTWEDLAALVIEIGQTVLVLLLLEHAQIITASLFQVLVSLMVFCL